MPDILKSASAADELWKHYSQMKLEPISVASVKDYCDSWDNLPSLTALAADLKDVQRPWMLKAIVSSVPAGSSICEIGAGEPFVANILQHLGYKVTVVDPYNGSGQGPTEFESYVAAYPNIQFFRETFRQQMPQFTDGCFDAIYSISVLEHLPLPEVPGLCRGIRRYTKPGGLSIHAVDHVLRGAGDAHHLRQLLVYADGLGIPRPKVEKILQDCELDPETYFLSAEAHNRWRGATPYDAFPMRKVVSVNLASRLP